jgi:hypothetical protein
MEWFKDARSRFILTSAICDNGATLGTVTGNGRNEAAMRWIELLPPETQFAVRLQYGKDFVSWWENSGKETITRFLEDILKKRLPSSKTGKSGAGP